MFTRLKAMLIKEFIQLFRDPRMRGIIFITPVLQMMLFGYAVTTDIRHITTAVVDRDNSAESRLLIDRFVRSGYFQVVSRSENLNQLLDHDIAEVAIQIPPGFGNSKSKLPVQVLIDGTDANSAGVIAGYVQRLAASNHEGPRTRIWFNENLESRNFFIPGIIAALLTMVSLMLTSMSIVREKEVGTIEQIIVTPISRLEFILGKTIPCLLVGFFDVVVITLAGTYWFEVPIRGSFFTLLFASSLYVLTMLSVGLLISTISSTMQQALMTFFLIYQPMTLLSGFIFPIANMPIVIQWITYLNPLRYFLVIIRGIFLKGVGFEILWPEMAALALMGVVTLSVVSRRFQKTME